MFSAEEICHYWLHSFANNENDLTTKFNYWFSVDRKRDRQLRRRFISYTVMAAEGALDHWTETPTGRLAVILLMDRFTRSAFRNTELAFAHDKQVQQLCLEGVGQGLDRNLSLQEKMFFYFPLISSERLTVQQQATPLLKCLLELEGDEGERKAVNALLALNERNMLLLKKFKCYPHRKKMRGNALSEEEKCFVDHYQWENWL